MCKIMLNPSILGTAEKRRLFCDSAVIARKKKKKTLVKSRELGKETQHFDNPVSVSSINFVDGN